MEFMDVDDQTLSLVITTVVIIIAVCDDFMFFNILYVNMSVPFCLTVIGGHGYSFSQRLAAFRQLRWQQPLA